MPLSTLLSRGNNNIDLFRLIAACMVIYAHAFVFVPRPGAHDHINALLVFDDAGSLAVKVFFFLSGLVVTNSLIEKRNVVAFVIARLFRLWPALLMVLLVTALVIGPVFSNLGLSDYYSQPLTRAYLLDNLLLRTRFELPGVFVSDGSTNSVNGSLWTLSYEVAAYLVLAACFLIGVFHHRALAMAVGVLLIVDPLFSNKLLLTWLPQQHWINLLPPCFAFGSLLALYKDKVQIGPGLLVGLYALLFVFGKSAFVAYFFYAALFCSILYVSGLQVVLRLKPRIDISYGVYLWGFPVQQMLARLFPHEGPIFNQLVAVALSMALGYLSWHLVEKHGIRLGAQLSRKLAPP